MSAWRPETLAEKRLNRRASLLAREIRARFPDDPRFPRGHEGYVGTLRLAREVIDTIVELEREHGGSATWVGQA